MDRNSLGLRLRRKKGSKLGIEVRGLSRAADR